MVGRLCQNFIRYHLVGEWFVDEASDAAAVHRDPDHHRHVLRQVLSVLLGRVYTQKVFFL